MIRVDPRNMRANARAAEREAAIKNMDRALVDARLEATAAHDALSDEQRHAIAIVETSEAVREVLQMRRRVAELEESMARRAREVA